VYFGGHNRVSLELHLEAIIKRVWRYTWRPESSQFGEALKGCKGASLDKYWMAVNGQHAGCWDYFHQLVHLQPWECDKVTLPVSSHGELADCSRSCWEARQKLKLPSQVNL